jgi:hypothetical protein
MASNLFPTPPVFNLPFSEGGDLYCIFVYKPLVVDGDGNPILDGQGQKQYAVDDYPAGSSVTLTIDTETPLVQAASITGSQAVVQIDKALTGPSQIPKGKLWHVVISYTGGRDIVMCNGVTVRADGKQ